MNKNNATPANPGKDPRVHAAAREVAEQVGREILESRLEPGAWATALAETRGRKQEALAAYTRIRVKQLTKVHRMQKVKNRSFESRRIAKCMGDNETREAIARTIQDMLHNSRRDGSTKNYFKPRVSFLWLMLLFIGTAGSVASLCRMLVPRFPELFNYPPALIAALAGVATVWGALVLRYFLPKRWVMLGWNTGIVVVCNLVCLCSLFLGTKLIKQAAAKGISVVPAEESAKPLKPKATARKETHRDTYLVSSKQDPKSEKN
jgi:hypothetical protein